MYGKWFRTKSISKKSAFFQFNIDWKSNLHFVDIFRQRRMRMERGKKVKCAGLHRSLSNFPEAYLSNLLEAMPNHFDCKITSIPLSFLLCFQHTQTHTHILSLFSTHTHTRTHIHTVPFSFAFSNSNTFAHTLTHDLTHILQNTLPSYSQTLFNSLLLFYTLTHIHIPLHTHEQTSQTHPHTHTHRKNDKRP